eukprot:PhM_4_TR18458/c0_g1_i1/m.34339
MPPSRISIGLHGSVLSITRRVFSSQHTFVPCVPLTRATWIPHDFGGPKTCHVLNSLEPMTPTEQSPDVMPTYTGRLLRILCVRRAWVMRWTICSPASAAFSAASSMPPSGYQIATTRSALMLWMEPPLRMMQRSIKFSTLQYPSVTLSMALGSEKSIRWSGDTSSVSITTLRMRSPTDVFVMTLCSSGELVASCSEMRLIGLGTFGWTFGASGLLLSPRPCSCFLTSSSDFTAFVSRSGNRTCGMYGAKARTDAIQRCNITSEFTREMCTLASVGSTGLGSRSNKEKHCAYSWYLRTVASTVATQRRRCASSSRLCRSAPTTLMQANITPAAQSTRYGTKPSLMLRDSVRVSPCRRLRMKMVVFVMAAVRFPVISEGRSVDRGTVVFDTRPRITFSRTTSVSERPGYDLSAALR